MKNIIAIIFIAIIVNLLAWLFFDAWDKEESLRIERNRQYIQMLRDENAANERRR